ncbi:condensin complex subunit 2-like protein [Tanacetum coccineum]
MRNTVQVVLSRQELKQFIAISDSVLLSIQVLARLIELDLTLNKYSPYSTLESSFDTLNVKKFDVAFSVDPLYHQTSAQFDEGGAKGLLLNNLGVYGGCRVLFDSLEVPRNCMSCSAQSNIAETIDISYAKDCMEQMVINILKNKEISPTLKDIVTMFDEHNRRPPDTFSSAQKSVEPDFEAYDNNNFDGGEQHDHSGTWDFVNDTTNGPTDEGTYDRGDEPFMHNYHEENEDNASGVYDVDDKFIGVDDLMFLKLGLTARQNAWAGPDHWKYQKAKGLFQAKLIVKHPNYYHLSSNCSCSYCGLVIIEKASQRAVLPYVYQFEAFSPIDLWTWFHMMMMSDTLLSCHDDVDDDDDDDDGDGRDHFLDLNLGFASRVFSMRVYSSNS